MPPVPGRDGLAADHAVVDDAILVAQANLAPAAAQEDPGLVRVGGVVGVGLELDRGAVLQAGLLVLAAGNDVYFGVVAEVEAAGKAVVEQRVVQLAAERIRRAGSRSGSDRGHRRASPPRRRQSPLPLATPITTTAVVASNNALRFISPFLVPARHSLTVEMSSLECLSVPNSAVATTRRVPSPHDDLVTHRPEARHDSLVAAGSQRREGLCPTGVAARPHLSGTVRPAPAPRSACPAGSSRARTSRSGCGSGRPPARTRPAPRPCPVPS